MNGQCGLGSMPPYTHVDRIARGLAARGIGPNDAIPPDQLFALDQWHYHGTDAVRDAALFLCLGATSRVLDIGAGVGGAGCFLSPTTGCHLNAPPLAPQPQPGAPRLSRPITPGGAR